MGRTVIAEDRMQRVIENLCASEPISLGLIIGQVTQQKDYAFHLVRTPPPEYEGSDGEEASAKKKTKLIQSLNDVQESWVVFHAKQVLRMLTGGIEILGVFAHAPPDMMKSAQPKLRQFLYAVQKIQTKSKGLTISEDEVTDKVLLHICSATKKLTCRTFDISDNKCAMKPAEWKFQSYLDRMIDIRTSLSVELVLPVTTEAMDTSLNKQLQNNLTPICRQIWSAVTTFGGQLRSDNSLLDTRQDQPKKGKGKQKDTSSGPLSLNANLFADLASDDSKKTEVLKCGAKLYIRGTVQGRGIVHNKTTVKEAKQAIKRDVIKTLQARCELLCEDLLQAEEEQDPRVLYETPLRVFGCIPGTPITLCDYMFQDEATTDSVDRFQALLDLSLTEEDIESTAETLPEPEDLVKPDISIADLPTHQTKPRTSGFSLNSFAMAAGGLIAALAAGISYIYLGET